MAYSILGIGLSYKFINIELPFAHLSTFTMDVARKVLSGSKPNQIKTMATKEGQTVKALGCGLLLGRADGVRLRI